LKRSMRWILPLFVLLFAWTPAAAAPVDGGRAKAVEIVDGDTLVLESGLEVRLVGIQAPKLPLDRPNFAKWPLADEAKAALSRLALGKTLRLEYGGRERDRYGRALAHLYDQDGVWVQGALLAEGMARVYSFRDNRFRVKEMLRHERAARAARRGIWGHPYYRIIDAEEAPGFIGSFQLIEGTVAGVAVVAERLYINFGTDWRSDFTVTFSPQDRRLLERAGFDYVGLKGQRIRVRGWLKSYNGPMIEATHPEQIEVEP